MQEQEEQESRILGVKICVGKNQTLQGRCLSPSGNWPVSALPLISIFLFGHPLPSSAQVPAITHICPILKIKVKFTPVTLDKERIIYVSTFF